MYKVVLADGRTSTTVYYNSVQMELQNGYVTSDMGLVNAFPGLFVEVIEDKASNTDKPVDERIKEIVKPKSGKAAKSSGGQTAVTAESITEEPPVTPPSVEPPVDEEGKKNVDHRIKDIINGG
jgi:hypothetical protein